MKSTIILAKSTSSSFSAITFGESHLLVTKSTIPGQFSLFLAIMFVCLRKGVEFHETKHSPQTSQHPPMVAASKPAVTIFHPGCMRISNGAALKNTRPERQQVKKLIKVIFMGIR
jgi:hypothetical protein